MTPTHHFSYYVIPVSIFRTWLSCSVNQLFLEMNDKHDDDKIIATAAILAIFILILLVVCLLFKQTHGR